MALSIADTDTNCYGPVCRCEGGTWGQNYFIMFTSDDARIALLDTGAQTITAQGAGTTDVIAETVDESGGPSIIPATDYGLIAYTVNRGIGVGGSLYAKTLEPAAGAVTANASDNDDYSFYAGGGQTQYLGSTANSVFVQALSASKAVVVWSEGSQVPLKNYGRYVIVDLSGSAVTVNTVQYIDDPANDAGDNYIDWFLPIAMHKISSNQVILIYEKEGRVGDPEIYAAIGTVSGTSMALSDETLIFSGAATAPVTPSRSNEQCATLHPYNNKILQPLYYITGFGRSYWYKTDSALDFGVATQKADFPYPCPGSAMGQDQFLTAAYDDNGTNNPIVQVVTIESDDTVTLEAITVELTTGSSVQVTDIFVIQAGLAVVFGNTDGWVIIGAEIEVAEEGGQVIEYWQGTNGIGAAAKATLTITSISGPAALATFFNQANTPVWIASDEPTDTRFVEKGDSSDSYAAFADETGVIDHDIEALAKVE